MPNLKYILSIEFKKALEGVKTVDGALNRIYQSLGKPIILNADGSPAIEEIEEVEAAADIDDKETVLSADSEDAVAGAEEAAAAVESVPDEKPIDFSTNADDVIGSMGKIGLAINGVTQAYAMLKNKVSDYVTLSNVQELAEKRLEITLKNRGVLTAELINHLKGYASEIQNLTTIGDEQSLGLITLATNMGISVDKITEATRGAIGLTASFKDAGLGLETAMKGLALAYQGEYTQLQRYIPELRSASDETEKLAILQRAMADGFELAKNEVQTGSGVMGQYQNLIGDLKEKVGDVIKAALVPLVTVLANIAKIANSHPAIFKAVVAALAAMAIAVVALTVKQLALNTALAIGAALSGNWIGLAAAAAVGFAAWAAGNALLKSSTDDLTESQKDLNQEVETTQERYERLFQAGRQAAAALDYEQAKENLKSVSSEIDNLLAQYNATRDQGAVFIPVQADADKLNELYAQENALRERIREEDLVAQEKYLKEKAEIDRSAALEGIELIQYQLNRAKKTYEEMGEADAENAEKKLELYELIIDLERQLAAQQKDIRKQDLENELQLLQLKQKNNYDVTDEIKTTYGELLEYLKDTYGEDSAEYQQALAQKNAYNQEHSLSIANKRREEIAAERAEREALSDFEYRLLNIEDPVVARLNRQKQAVEDWFAQKHDLLIEAGKTEEEITAAKNRSIEALENASMQYRISSGARALGQMAKNIEDFGKIGFNISKALNIAQVLMETPAAAMAAYKAVVGIPVVGPYLAPLAAAATIAQGALTVKQITQAKPPKAASGGILRGNRHSTGGIIIEAEDEEYITSRDRVRALGAGLFNFLNFAPLDTVKAALSGLQVPNTLPPVPVLSGVYAAGGSVSENQSMGVIINRLERIEKAINLKKITGVLDLKDSRSRSDRYEGHLRDKAYYEKRNR